MPLPEVAVSLAAYGSGGPKCGRRLGACGGVFGDVRRYGSLSQLLAVVEVGGADWAEVELAAEDEAVHPAPAVNLRPVDACGIGGGSDGIGEQLGRGPGRR